MPGMSVTLRSGLPEDVFDALGMALDGGGAVAVAADAERILAGDLHQVGGFPEDARDLLVLHPSSILALDVAHTSARRTFSLRKRSLARLSIRLAHPAQPAAGTRIRVKLP